MPRSASESHPTSSAVGESVGPKEQRPERILAIDALRGFDMFWIAGPDIGHWLVTSLLALMIGPLPEWLRFQLNHPAWLGFSAWDMIMPLFLFIVGAAMPFSIGRRLEAGDGRREIYLRALRRVTLLWILGMIAQGNLLQFRLDTLKLYSNTLQAIAAGYLIATVVMVELRRPLWQGCAAAASLTIYWLLMSFVPTPGHAAGVYEPDDNLAIRIDRALLGPFQDGTHYTWILSSLGFGATVLIGVLAGHALRAPLPPERRLRLLIAAGLACLAAGWAWSFSMPIIKHLWTSSMVLWAGGWSLLLLALFYGLIDVLAWRRWCFPFVVIGANAIVAYMVQPLLDLAHLSRHLFAGLCGHFGEAQDFALALLTFVCLWSGLWWLYRKRVFIRI